jgi:cytochrome c biogenesis factor
MLPFAVLIVLLLGFSLRAQWNQNDSSFFFKKLIIPGILSVIVLIVFVVIGMHNVLAALLVLASLFAFFVSVHHGYLVAKEKPWFIGGAISHAGLALLFLSIVASEWYGQRQLISLPMDQPKLIFGFELKYVGTTPAQDGETKFVVSVEYNNKHALLEPTIFLSSYNNNVIRKPDYLSYWTKDIYIEPISIEQNNNIKAVEKKSDTEEVKLSDIFIAEVSVKPFMSFVWIAAAMIFIGLVITMVRRLRQNNV